MPSPQLTFACELESDELQALFADPAIVDTLQTLGASVSLGLLDLHSERAGVVRHLNQAGVPVVAWLLLPKEQGYWFNLSNVSQAMERYADFHAWSAEHNLRWEAVALDIEPDIQEFRHLAAGEWRPVLPGILRRVFNPTRLRRGQFAYAALVAHIRADGYRVDAYHFPFLIDERQAGSTLLRRLAGLVDVPADREGFMLYSSFARPYGPGYLWSYGPDVRLLGVGSTGGGVEVAGLDEIPPLTWEEFERDLRLARRWTDDLFIFSLEGCVRQDFLARLPDFDWDRPIPPPLEKAQSVDRIRRVLRAVLWASARPLLVLAGLVAVVYVLSRLFPARRDDRKG